MPVPRNVEIYTSLRNELAEFLSIPVKHIYVIPRSACRQELVCVEAAARQIDFGTPFLEKKSMYQCSSHPEIQRYVEGPCGLSRTMVYIQVQGLDEEKIYALLGDAKALFCTFIPNGRVKFALTYKDPILREADERANRKKRYVLNEKRKKVRIEDGIPRPWEFND